MRVLHLFMLLGLASLAPAQEPAPEEPPTEAPEPGEEQPPSRAEMMEQIMQAIDEVRASFVRVDRTWTEARSTANAIVGEVDPERPAELRSKLEQGVADADQLIQDLEELLAMLPESDQQQQQQPSPSDSSQQSPSNPQQQPEGEQPQDADEPRDEGQLEGNQATNQPAPGDRARQSPAMLFAPGQGGGSWGHLPPRLQETLQNAHAEDLPLRYRHLLEEFHKRRQPR